MIPALISLVAIALMCWLAFEVTRADDPLLADEEYATDYVVPTSLPLWPLDPVQGCEPPAGYVPTLDRVPAGELELDRAAEVWARARLAEILARLNPVPLERRVPGANLGEVPELSELDSLRDRLVGKGVVLRPAAPEHGDVTDEGLVRVA